MESAANLSSLPDGFPAPPDSAVWRRIGPRRGEILLIEDRNDVREGLAQLLELNGFMVIEAPNADRGLLALEAEPNAFALIVLDLHLPGTLDGPAFRGRQLADVQLSGIPTVVITASDVNDADRERLHADGWLDKPFRFDNLLDLVKRFVVSEGGQL